MKNDRHDRPLLALVGAILAIATFASSLHACFVCIVPYQSLLDKVEASQHTIVARAVDDQQTQWQVVRVLRGDGIDVGQTVAAQADRFVSGQSQMLHRAALTEPWIVETAIDDELLAFLVNATGLSTGLSKDPSIREQSRYYRFFLPYLEHAHPLIADSAYNKIARAPYNVLTQIGTELDPDQLLAWIEQPEIAQKRGSLYITLLGICGGQRESAQIKAWIDAGWQRQDTENLGALLAAHVELNGEETIRFIEKSYIQNRDRKLGELIAAINTLRVHGQADGKVSRARIMATIHLLLRERPALAEMIIEDCARWEDWSIAPRLMELYASGRQPWNNAMIINYLQACPEPAAAQFVKRVSPPDAEGSKEEKGSGTNGRNGPSGASHF